jgi:LmbE family N-acetylglucosaminyl deacetylase
LALSLVALATSACATLGPPGPAPSLEALLERPEARVMWVGAHPDDESAVGPILARACIALGRPCYFLVYTRGEGGACPFKPRGCFPDLASVRTGEIRRSAKAYRAELELHRFWNVPLPAESFPPPDAVAARWRKDGDPGGIAAAAIRRFRPTILLTFEPDHGFTDHPEHKLAARFAAEGMRRAARDPVRIRTGYRPPTRC